MTTTSQAQPATTDRAAIRAAANDPSPAAAERTREIIAALVAQSRARNSGEVRK